VQVWTRNRYSGVVGAFHLQGAFWDRVSRRFKTQQAPPTLSAAVSPWDVACMHEVIDELPGVWAGAFVVLRNSSGATQLLDDSGEAEITLDAGDADTCRSCRWSRGQAKCTLRRSGCRAC
jgi:Raffinose synthase or seed imbibition protein Sip1